MGEKKTSNKRKDIYYRKKPEGLIRKQAPLSDPPKKKPKK